MKKKIAIVAGGDSSEHDVSLRSAAGIMSFMDHDLYDVEIVEMKSWDANDTKQSQAERLKMLEKLLDYDFCYITIHGTPGENGLLQGYLDMMHIPYSNPGVLASAITFNKYACNHYLENFGITISPSVLLRKGEAIDMEAVKALGYPMFIKSNVGGSSFGCTKVKSEADIEPAIASAFKEGDEVICEAFMKGTEVTSGVYRAAGKQVSFPITEVVAHNEFFDYDAKYNGQVDEITPARVPDEIRDEVQALTQKIYGILGCQGIIRTDYIITGLTVDKDGKSTIDEGGYTIKLMEVNTTPGMTATSFIPQQVRAAGLDITNVLTEIIENKFV